MFPPSVDIEKKKGILDNLTKYVRDEMEKELIPPDAKYVLIGDINLDGTKIIAAVNIKKTDKVSISVAAVWKHDWDGDDIAGAKLIFVGK